MQTLNATLPMPTLARLSALASVALLGACVAGAHGPDVSTGASAGQYPIALAEGHYLVAVGARSVGRVHSKAGAQSVQGLRVAVQGLAGALSYDDGAIAKRAARAACAKAGGRLNETALGAFNAQAGAWVFEGGCA